MCQYPHSHTEQAPERCRGKAELLLGSQESLPGQIVTSYTSGEELDGRTEQCSAGRDCQEYRRVS